MLPRVFVYGTLMPGRLRWGLLSDVAVSHRPASVAGVLHDTGEGWPAARFGPTPRDAEPEGAPHPVIPGWVVDVDPAAMAELLVRLDEVETGFRRVRVRTVDDEEAWSYEVPEPDAAWQVIERWDGRAER